MIATFKCVRMSLSLSAISSATAIRFTCVLRKLTGYYIGAKNGRFPLEDAGPSSLPLGDP